ncbi:hypothetical protein M3M33_09840 [Loigolactobacillus coryniformis]|uniref:hypothetical protein n=1 Tax=Loigolactobacillus coryniformis TaxID=1610 RepID=UPI00201A2585|nr:hypothetical protein [Loigolactobacillus coryniformis]MCL5458953.1 hypothetical protein [Loigolactobacillus coryniformis]
MIDLDDLENWQPIYQEISELFGTEIAKKIYQQYRGTTIIFPMHWLSKCGTINAIKQDYANGLTIRKLSQKYDLSQRTVQRYMKL